MALTTIDAKPALVVVDLQKGVVALPTVHPVDAVVERAPGRTEVARPMPAPAPDWADLVEELDAQPDDHRVTKVRWGAFHGTSLDTFLRDRGVTQVVIAGIATSAGVESTARGAHEHGYHVVLATDAMTDLDLEVHRNSVERIFPRLGETGTSDEIVALLDRTR